MHAQTAMPTPTRIGTGTSTGTGTHTRTRTRTHRQKGAYLHRQQEDGAAALEADEVLLLRGHYCIVLELEVRGCGGGQRWATLGTTTWTKSWTVRPHTHTRTTDADPRIHMEACVHTHACE
jgi:hypothetical protein